MERFSSFKEKMVLRESKESTLKKCVNLTQEQREEALQFFNGKGQSFWSAVDWNRPKEVTWADIQTLMDKAENTASAQKKKIKNNQTLGLNTVKEGTDYEVMGQGEGWVLYHLLSHRGACVIASNEVEPKVRNDVPSWAQNDDNEWYNSNTYDAPSETADGGHWCIAMFKTPKYWNDYTSSGMEFYILCINDPSLPDCLRKMCFQKHANGKNLSIWIGSDENHMLDDFKREKCYPIVKACCDIIVPPPSEEDLKKIEQSILGFMGEGCKVTAEGTWDLRLMAESTVTLGGDEWFLRLFTPQLPKDTNLGDGVLRAMALEFATGGTEYVQLRLKEKNKDTALKLIAHRNEFENTFNHNNFSVCNFYEGSCFFTLANYGSDLDAFFKHCKGAMEFWDKNVKEPLLSLEVYIDKLISRIFPNYEVIKDFDGEYYEKYKSEHKYYELFAIPSYFREADGSISEFTLAIRLNPEGDSLEYISNSILSNIFMESYGWSVDGFTRQPRSLYNEDKPPCIIYTLTMDISNVNAVEEAFFDIYSKTVDNLRETAKREKRYKEEENGNNSTDL